MYASMAMRYEALVPKPYIELQQGATRQPEPNLATRLPSPAQPSPSLEAALDTHLISLTQPDPPSARSMQGIGYPLFLMMTA
jgi:hypothetical protein